MPTTPHSTTRLRPVIRVFVSSTFSDMKHERNVLAADAFPKLEQLCQRQGFQFQAIDLRWGVSTEAALDHRTMRICFDELRRAQEISPRPNFLILLGNRYGWRPLPEEISVEEFHTLEQAAAQIPNSADKSAVAVLREWYREDTNAVPPVYLLQSRRQDLGDDQDYTHDAVWNQVQAVLWTIINRAMPPEHLQWRFDGAAAEGSLPAIVRFQASATEQEIWHGALCVPDAREHVLAFFREIENLAAFPDPKPIKDFVDVAPFGVPPSGGSGRVNAELQTSGAWIVDETLGAEQERLKTALRQRLGSANVFRNEVPVRLGEAQDNQGGRTADVTTDHLAQLCADVVSRLSEIIQGQIEAYWRHTAQASTDRAARELEIEQREYERFAQERGGEDSFVGRQVELQAILDYVGSNSRWSLVIHGPSGCGKTALLARASQEVAKTRNRIERFIGVAPRSSDLRSLLSSLCQELRQRNPRADALPTEIKELRDEFSQHLQAATAEQPLILFLDALDQLADVDNGRLLHWLSPGSLPAHVKLVVSCLSDRATGDPAGQPYAELKRRQIPAGSFINLDVLSETEARLLLFDRWLPKADRKVSDDQRARIEHRLASPACRQPIFLKLLFEEIQLWHSYDPAPVPGESVPALLGQLFDRLSQPTNHGPLLVNRVLGYLSASRHGLAENEILEILFADPEYRAKLNEATEQTRHELPPNAKRIPIALWSRLRFDLAPYLTERAAPGANVLMFYHRLVPEWVATAFVPAPDRRDDYRMKLANYFEAELVTARTCDELPWLLWKTQQRDRLRTCLLDIARFLIIQKRGEDELLDYWVFLQEEMTMGQRYRDAFLQWMKKTYSANDSATIKDRELGILPFRLGVDWSLAANDLSKFLLHASLIQDAEILSRLALSISASETTWPGQVRKGLDVSNLARTLFAQGRHDEAEPLCQEALAIFEANFGPDDDRVGAELNNLATVFIKTGREADAEPLLRRALAIHEKNLGPNASEVAIVLNNLVPLLQNSNRLTEAEVLARRALAIDEQHYGSTHSKTAIRLNTLARILQSTQRLSDAETLYRRALAADENHLGPHHAEVATDLNNLATLLLETKKFEEAETLLRRSLAIEERVYGSGNPELIPSLNNLAQVLEKMNRMAEAEPIARRALESSVAFTRKMGRPHPYFSGVANNYAKLLVAMGLGPEDVIAKLKAIAPDVFANARVRKQPGSP